MDFAGGVRGGESDASLLVETVASPQALIAIETAAIASAESDCCGSAAAGDAVAGSRDTAVDLGCDIGAASNDVPITFWFTLADGTLGSDG